MKTRTFTSESVTPGQPDKVADQIADAILDHCLKSDPHSRVSVVVMLAADEVIIRGQITSKTNTDPEILEPIVRQVLRDVGYTDEQIPFHADTVAISTRLVRQSKDIALGLSQIDPKLIGAGDQGMVFGYATDETREYLPLSLLIAHRMTAALRAVRSLGVIEGLRPDGKAQVTICYDEAGVPHCETVVLSASHDKRWNHPDLQAQLRAHLTGAVVNSVLEEYGLEEPEFLHINPTGRFEICGPAADIGISGRKIMVDTYGGIAHHGGGSFSGKDPTKVERSGAYMARWIAVNLVAAKLCKSVEVQLSYSIGIAEPTSVDLVMTGAKASYEVIKACILELFDLRPGVIAKQLDLLRPFYRETAENGHFGPTVEARGPEYPHGERPRFTWDTPSMAERLAKAVQAKTARVAAQVKPRKAPVPDGRPRKLVSRRRS